MTAAPLAGAAAAIAVAALWESVAAAEALAPAHWLERTLAPLSAVARGGREPSTPERRRLALVGAATLVAGGWLLAGPVAGLACGAGGPFAVTALLRARQRRYRAELERAAPAVARAIADALGAGHSIGTALSEAADGASGAAAVELTAIAAALALGTPAEAALEQLRTRAGSRAFDTLCAAILLQREAGGDLATLLRELAAAQEQAARLADDARAVTAQARFTGLVVGMLPAGAAALAELARPGTLGEIAAVPIAAWMALFALVLQFAALVAIRRLARVIA
ncbi:type II secretion system F family protein [Conexibacter sp. JD483]|uniref:type II secretion system F family protein n=1 Tax=unclassified Conexibacter TaxID=2627773 RepID=UPI00271FB1C9|nr:MULTISPECIES: type II secretion system F family protein [unclassified Conexibacter]MDO8184631.1 type II secretion system F family protein [Conexibacter sp. CPCC 205706]MDO8197937.1 type II secretion system F family protein [Conexibacter sp. CPCC 205762]MDR9372875.1 type II secretion system F family protein [Conexibacter sp. JD483]